MDADAGYAVAATLDLTRVYAGPDRQAHGLEVFAHLEGAAHGAGRAVEAREQPVTGEVGDDSPESLHLLAPGVLEGLEQLSPSGVAQLDCALGGGDDVREEHGREHSVAVVRAGAGE